MVARVPGRIVLFGATGYTGRLTASALVAAGAKPLLAGRSRTSLESLATELGGDLDVATADVGDPPSVRALLEPGDVMVSTVGPFRRWGAAAIEAAIEAGCALHRLDRRAAVHPPRLRRVGPPRRARRRPVADRARLRLGARQPRRGPGARRGRRGGPEGRDRLLHHRQRDGRDERRHDGFDGRRDAGARVRVPGRPGGHRGRGAADPVLRRSRQAAAGGLDRLVRALHPAAAEPRPDRRRLLPRMVRGDVAADADHAPWASVRSPGSSR